MGNPIIYVDPGGDKAKHVYIKLYGSGFAEGAVSTGFAVDPEEKRFAGTRGYGGAATKNAGFGIGLGVTLSSGNIDTITGEQVDIGAGFSLGFLGKWIGTFGNFLSFSVSKDLAEDYDTTTMELRLGKGIGLPAELTVSKSYTEAYRIAKLWLRVYQI